MTTTLTTTPNSLQYPFLLPADLVFTAGNRFMSRAIRWRTGSDMNHVGGIINTAPVPYAHLLEALHPRVVSHSIANAYGGKDDRLSVYRATNITDRDKEMIVEKAKSYIGKKYGWGKIILHAIPGAAALAFSDRWPICNWIWAQAYHSAGYHFGTTIDRSTPGTMLAYCRDRNDKYELVWDGSMREWSAAPVIAQQFVPFG